jgi:hypothetical protein
MAEQPNDAARKSKAEGDRMDEESSSQKSEPSHGQAKCGPPDSDMDLKSGPGTAKRKGQAMNRDNRSSSHDPTAEPTRDQSTQSASGLTAGRDREDKSKSDPINRQPLETPRRYDQPIEDDEDPVMPADDATVNTKI